MLVQTNGSYPFSNPFAPALSETESVDTTAQLEQLKNDYNMIYQELKPNERKLYDNLINAENYQAAKGIVTIGFMRASGLYEDVSGTPLEGESLPKDLARLNPPSSPKEERALKALSDHLSLNPAALEIDQTRRGNLLDLRI